LSSACPKLDVHKRVVTGVCYKEEFCWQLWLLIFCNNVMYTFIQVVQNVGKHSPPHNISLLMTGEKCNWWTLHSSALLLPLPLWKFLTTKKTIYRIYLLPNLLPSIPWVCGQWFNQWPLL
jgi:hypothetical protein